MSAFDALVFLCYNAAGKDVLFMWQFLWPLFGAVALILALINLFVARKGKRNTAVKLLVISLVFGLLTLLSEYAMVNFWVQNGDWSALADVVPGMYKILTVSVLILEGLNVLSAILLIKRRK